MEKQENNFMEKHKTIWQFIKYTLFSLIAGVLEIGSFVLLNYLLPAKGVNKAISWFIFSYPTETGGLGALIAFLVSSVIGQTVAFITNFKKTFASTNNVFLSAIGFAIMAIFIIVVIHTYIGGLLNTALCNVIPNSDIAGAIAKIICQVSGFLLAFPINKFILMRHKKPAEDATTQPVNNAT